MHRMPLASPGSADGGEKKEEEEERRRRMSVEGVVVQVWTFN